MSLLVLLNQTAGSQTVDLDTSHYGIATVEALGSPVAAGPISSAGAVAGAEAFGTLTATVGAGVQTLSPSGIASGEAVGSESWCGNTYYVTTAGNDTTGNGSLATPWRNVNKLLAALPRYGIGKIRTGTYLETPAIFTGSRGEFLIVNYPGDTVVVQSFSSPSSNQNLWNMENVRGISFTGGGTRTLGDGTSVSYDGSATGSLTIEKYLLSAPALSGTASLIRFYYDSSKVGAANLWGNADRVRIRGVNFGAVNGYAIRCASFNVAGEVNDIVIEGCDFNGAANSISLSYADGVYIQYNRFLATGRMIDNSGDNNDNGGVHVSIQTGSHNVYTRYNTITGGIAASTYYGFDGGAVEFYGCYDTDTSYNLISDCEGAIEDGTPNRTTWTMNNNVVHHNTFRGRFAWGTTATPTIGPNDSPVILHRAGSNYRLYNNTFDLTGPHGNAVRMQYSTGGNYNGEIDGSRIENNLILLRYAPYQFNPGQGVGGTAPPLYPGGAGQPLNNAWAGIGLELNNVQVETGIVVDYNNLWNTTGDVRVAVYNGTYYTRSQVTTFRSGTPYGDHDVWADPVVIDADGGDYHLEETSPLIDAGLDLFEDGLYIGAAPDIGRFEYQLLPLLVSSTGAIASLEAFGTAVLTTGAVTVNLDEEGLGSAAAFGTASLFVGVFTAGGIASEEAFGTPAFALLTTAVSNAGAIASEEAFGTGGLAGTIVGGIGPAAILSEEALGSPTLTGTIATVEGLTTVRYIVAYDTDYDDADADYQPLIQYGGSGEVSAAGREQILEQVRDYQTIWNFSFEVSYPGGVTLPLTGEFSAYFVNWVTLTEFSGGDIQIRYGGTGTPGALPFFFSPAELAALPLVAHLPSFDIVQNARNTFITDDDSIIAGLDLAGNNWFVLHHEDILTDHSVGEGASEVASWIAGGAFADPEDIAAYQPFLTLTYLVVAEGTMLPSGIATEEALGAAVLTQGAAILTPAGIASAEYVSGDPLLEEGPFIGVGPVTVSVSGIASEESFVYLEDILVSAGQVFVTVSSMTSVEAFGSVVVEIGAAVVTPSAIDTLEALGSVAVTSIAYVLPVGITSVTAFGVTRIMVIHAPRGLTGAIEYVVEIFNSGTGFGPGTKIGELWESRNLGWSRYDRLPGKAFLTLYQDSPHLSLFSPLTTHVKITRVTPVYDTQVYAGEFIDYDSTGDDVVLSFFDYVSLFAVSRSGYKTMYPKKKLGTEIAQPEIQAALSATYSPLGFVTMGTIQNPVGMDGTTEILTNEQFGTMDQLRLQLLWDLSEMARVNTNNHVTFEISRTPPYVVNFWKNRGVNQNFGLILNGSVDDYQYLPNWTRYRNDLATLGTTTGGGATEIVKTNETAAAVRARRQDVATIKTLLGITSSAVELDQQHAATSAMLTALTQRTPMLQVNLVRDALAPFEGWEICDTAIVEIDNGVDHLVARQRIVGARCIYTEAGEDMGLILEPIPS